jgi:hypothetical protein
MPTQTTQAYKHGLDDGYYGFTYIDPNYTQEQLDAYAKGYAYGKTIPAFWRSEQEASDNATRSAASG